MTSIWIALVIDLLIADPYWFPHPVRIIGKYVSIFEKISRKIAKRDFELKIAGFILVITTITLTYLIAWWLLKITTDINIILYNVVNILMLWTCMALTCLSKEAKKVYKALKTDDIQLARKNVSYLVARETSQLTVEGVTKATVETVVENTSDGMIAPLFFMLIGGAPLALAYKAINTMDSMVGYKNDKYKEFGYAAATLDDIVNYIPARITGFFIVIATWIYRLDYKNSWKILLRDRRNHSSPNSAYPEAAAAGALSVQLGGTNKYFGEIVHKPTIGDNNRNIQISDIKKAIHLMYISSIMLLVLGSLVVYILSKIGFNNL